MKELGFKAYRFSIAWSRILPEGTGEVNETGLQFYENLVDELCANDIIPCATLVYSANHSGLSGFCQPPLRYSA